jgi:hypoxanthine phosphoribosyltransferase
VIKELESYDHQHSGVLCLTWPDVSRLCRHLVEQIERDYRPEVIIGIAKGGAIPGAIIASMLRRDYFPVPITRREADVVTRKTPALLAHIPTEVVRGRKVLVTDEMVVTGETLRIAVDECWAQGATGVKTAALYIHTGGNRPDWFGLETESLVIQPWDAMVYAGGRWQLNQEYLEELERMGLSAGDALAAVLTELHP